MIGFKESSLQIGKLDRSRGNLAYTGLCISQNREAYQYAGTSLQFILPIAIGTEGYVKVSPNQAHSLNMFNYVFNYTDHLGNVRLSYSKDPQTGTLDILDESHYYPFGLKHGIYAAGNLKDFTLNGDIDTPILEQVLKTDYNYKYQGQELQDELGLGWYSYKWRNYNPEIARFMSIDPLTEEYEDYTPYQFSSNQPVHAPELEGLESSNDLNKKKPERTSSKILKTGLTAAVVVTQLDSPLPGPGDVAGAAIAFGVLGVSGIVYLYEEMSNSSNEEQSKSSNSQSKNESKTEENAERHGGGKNAQHKNQDAKNSAAEKATKAKAEYDSIKSIRNKTPEDKKNLQRAETQKKHWENKAKETGENHSQKAKGSN